MISALLILTLGMTIPRIAQEGSPPRQAGDSESYGALSVTTTDESGWIRPPGGDLQVGGYTTVHLELTRIGDEEPEPRQLQTRLHDADVRIGGLRSGDYRVAVHSQRHVSQELDCTVRAGETTRVRVQLEELPLATVSGTIRSQAGEKIVYPDVWLRQVDPPHRTFHADAGQDCTIYDAIILRSEDEDKLVFRFQGVPRGEYYVETKANNHALWPVRSRIRVGRDALDLVQLDDPEECGFRVQASSAGSGKAVRLAWITAAEPDPVFPLSGVVEPGKLLAPATFEDPLPDWILYARGHAPRHGTDGDFRPSDQGRTASVELEPGWGECIRVVDDEGAPLPDVEVFGDGTALGSSDLQGHLDVRMLRKPTMLVLFHEEWVVVGGDVHPESGRFQSRFQPLGVVMGKRR